MKYEATDLGYVFTRANGERIELTPSEVSFIYHGMERINWRGNIENAIELCEECFDFDAMDQQEFIQMCMDELESRWENLRIDDGVDYDELVFDMAQENKIWRNE